MWGIFLCQKMTSYKGLKQSTGSLQDNFLLAAQTSLRLVFTDSQLYVAAFFKNPSQQCGGFFYVKK